MVQNNKTKEASLLPAYTHLQPQHVPTSHTSVWFCVFLLDYISCSLIAARVNKDIHTGKAVLYFPQLNAGFKFQSIFESKSLNLWQNPTFANFGRVAADWFKQDQTMTQGLAVNINHLLLICRMSGWYICPWWGILQFALHLEWIINNTSQCIVSYCIAFNHRVLLV